MKIYKLCQFFNYLSKTSHHKVQKITEDKTLGYDYDDDFKQLVLEHYDNQLIRKMLDFGDLRLGLLLKQIEGEDGDIYNAWFEQYSKTYSPLGYYTDFEEEYEPFHRSLFKDVSNNITMQNV